MFEKFCRLATSKIKGVQLPKGTNWTSQYETNEDVLKSLKTAYGYLISNYNNPSQPVAPIFMDGEAEPIDALYLGGGDSQSGETYSLVVRNVSAGTHRLRWASTVSGVRTQGFHQNSGLFDIKAIYISPN